MTYRFKYAAHCREKNSFRLEIHWKFLEIHWKIISHFVERFILVRHLDVKQSNWRLHKCFHAIHKCFWIQNSCNFIALHFFPFIYITDPSLLCHVSSTGLCVCVLKTLCPTRNSLCQSLCAIFVIILKQSSRKKQKKAEMKNKLSVAEEKKRRSFEIQLSIKVYHFHFRCILFWSSFSYLSEYWIYLRVSVFIVLFVFLLYRAPKFSLHWDLFSAIFIHLFIYLFARKLWTLNAYSSTLLLYTQRYFYFIKCNCIQLNVFTKMRSGCNLFKFSPTPPSPRNRNSDCWCSWLSS